MSNFQSLLENLQLSDFKRLVEKANVNDIQDEMTRILKKVAGGKVSVVVIPRDNELRVTGPAKAVEKARAFIKKTKSDLKFVRIEGKETPDVPFETAVFNIR